jgi:hypothetical protein
VTGRIAIAILGLMAGVAGVCVVRSYRFLVVLRRDHFHIWEALCRPSPWLSRLEDVTAVQRFLLKRQYRELTDVALVRSAERLRLLTILTYGLAATALIAATIAKAVG